MKGKSMHPGRDKDMSAAIPRIVRTANFSAPQSKRQTTQAAPQKGLVK